MKVVLVDDEQKSLLYLEDILNQTYRVDIIGKFTDSSFAYEYILSQEPDIAFLDIHMPGINGLHLAKKIRAALPDINIVFITAYDYYAVKAFELHAQDYILKPFDLVRIKKTMDRIAVPKATHAKLTKTIASPPVICTFQSLNFLESFNDNIPLTVQWRTKRVKGIFLYLLQHRGKPILKDTLVDLFWPDFDLDKGYTQLYSTIYHMRKCLKDIHSDIDIVGYTGSYKLNLNKTKLDVNEWEMWLQRLPYITEENIDIHMKLLHMYKGDYLENEEYVWIEHERERLKSLWIGHVSNVAKYLASTSQTSEAISLYLRLQSTQPHLESSYFNLMNLYNEIGNFNAVESQFYTLKKVLSEDYGLTPTNTTIEWYDNWKKLNSTS